MQTGRDAPNVIFADDTLATGQTVNAANAAFNIENVDNCAREGAAEDLHLRAPARLYVSTHGKGVDALIAVHMAR
jgi:hypothetical protein